MPAAIPIAAAAIGAGASIYSANKAAKAAGQAGSGGTTSSEPWSGLQPYLSDIYARAQQQANVGPYEGPYIGEQSGYTQEGIAELARQAGDPNSLVSQAQGQLGRTIRGDYLNVASNPYLKGAVEEALGLAKTGVSSQFSGENFGSSANQEWLGRILANTALPTYANAYQQERQNQLNALQQAPGLQAVNPALMLQAGGLEEARSQAEANAGQAEWAGQWAPLQNYAHILGTIQNPGGTTTSTLPAYYDPIGAGLGGAGAGLALYNQFSQKPATSVYGAPQGSWVNDMPANSWSSFPW